ncbi:MAG: hypothetical protein ACKO96_05595, partial [Flammeovirgaceae bacterium]
MIGKNETSRELRRYYLMHQDEKLKFVKYFDFDANTFNVGEVENYCENNEVQMIFCCISNVHASQLKRLVDFALNSLISVKIVLGNEENKSIKLDDKLALADFAAIPIDEYPNQVAKRIFDFLFAMFLLTLVLSWLVPL